MNMVTTGFLIVAILAGWINGVPIHREPLYPPGFDVRYPEEVPGLFQGDIELGDENLFSRNAVGTKDRRWPNRIVPYVVHSYFTEKETRMIHGALKEIEEKTRVDGENCITFVNKTDEPTYLFYATGTGCHTRVGYTGHKQGVSLGHGCRYKGTVMHETLHALGFYHEQSRPDRDDFVKVVMENIQEKHKKNFIKLFPPKISTQNLHYDYSSLMHYSPFGFAINRDEPTLIPLRKHVDIGQRYGMSQLDIVQLQRLYGCKEQKLIKLQDPDTVSVNCTFDNELCGWTSIKIPGPSYNIWMRHRGKTNSPLTGPEVDHTFGTFEGYYLFTEASDNFFKVSRIQTPLFSKGDHCFTFWYHMKGRDMGSLNIIQVEGDSRRIPLFNLNGHQGKVWKQLKLNVQASENTKIEFESIIGSHFRSDIAIDDVIAYPGTC